MVIATPFDKDKHFYYNQKINCMRAEGWFSFDGKKYEFNSENGALATLDWGRGVWTYDNTWYWGSGQMILEDGGRFGFNIGYGFGNTSAASENMLFYNGTSHKLADVSFNIPKSGEEYLYMRPWTFTSSDGRFEMTFEPIIDRQAPLDIKLMCMLCRTRFSAKSAARQFLMTAPKSKLRISLCLPSACIINGNARFCARYSFLHIGFNSDCLFSPALQFQRLKSLN